MRHVEPSLRPGPTTLRQAARLSWLGAGLLLAGCAAFEQQGSGPGISAAPPAAAPRTLGVETQAAAEHKRIVALFGGEYHDAAAERYLNDVLTKIAAGGETPSDPYRVTILNSPIVNAFALPPGNLYVTRGLLSLANDGSEVAAVMAHEIAHITARHAMARAEQEKRAALISQAASVIQSKQKGEELEASAKMSIASFSRGQELEADRIGIRSIARAGFDPYGASRFLVALGRSSAMRSSLLGGAASAAKPDMLATHPSTPERVTAALNVAREIGAPGIGADARAPYLAAIDGLMFGDDPAEGTIRGRKFIHTRLGFTFTAPDGFTLENSAQAVLGVKAGGAEALRLDSVRVTSGTTLEAYLASGWIDGLLRSSIQSSEVNGMPAAFADARAGEWNFRLAVIRFDANEVYRLIFATHVLSDDAATRYAEAINSFRRAAPDEASTLHPLHIAIAAPRDGDTAQTLAARMVADRPLETFLLLNGLDQDGRLQPGERYKIVVE